MIAFHTICSKPKYEKNFDMSDSDILVMILSALNWRKNNGPIKLYADYIVIEFIKKLGIDFLWDDINILELEDIDYNTFWAGSKIFALKKQTTPVVMLDLDMIVWKNIFDKLNDDIVAIHSEPIIEQIYKDKDYFVMNTNYKFDDNFSWSVLPSNTALLYIADEKFKKYYCDKSIEFMKNSKKTDDSLSYMIFAEQRLLSMCADKGNKKVSYLIDYPKDLGNQDYFTHIWGYKSILSRDNLKNELFCKRCAKRILKEFPKESILLLNKDFFNKYLID